MPTTHDWAPTCAVCDSAAYVMEVTLFSDFSSHMRARVRVACHGAEEEFEMRCAPGKEGFDLPAKVFDFSPSGLQGKNFISHTITQYAQPVMQNIFLADRMIHFNPNEVKAAIAHTMSRKRGSGRPQRNKTPRRMLPEVQRRPQRLITLED